MKENWLRKDETDETDKTNYECLLYNSLYSTPLQIRVTRHCSSLQKDVIICHREFETQGNRD